MSEDDHGLDIGSDLENERIYAGELTDHDEIGAVRDGGQHLRPADLRERDLTSEHGWYALRARDIREVHVETVLLEEPAFLRRPERQLVADDVAVGDFEVDRWRRRRRGSGGGARCGRRLAGPAARRCHENGRE